MCSEKRHEGVCRGLKDSAAVLCLATLSCLTFCNPLDYSQAPLSMEFSRPEYYSGLPCPPPGNFPNPGIKPRSPAFQADSLLSEPPGKPKNTGVSSLSLLQGTFLTQELNQGLLHCRRILYQLSHQGIPRILEWVAYAFSKGSSQPRN